MMHQEKCPSCKIDNEYYDRTLKVDDSKSDAVSRSLEELKMTSGTTNYQPLRTL